MNAMQMHPYFIVKAPFECLFNRKIVPYGDNDFGYHEPTYLPGMQQKSNKRMVNRPDKPATSFALYPNPAHTFTEIHWKWMEQGLESGLKIQVYAPDGKLMETHEVADYKKNVFVLRTAKYPSGLYIVRINDEKGKTQFTQKLSIIKN